MQPNNEFSMMGFAKTFIRPALLIFLVPILSLLFFLHAQSTFDANFRKAVLDQIKADTTQSEQDRAANIEFFTQVPASTLVLHDEFAKKMNNEALTDYATFRWMIRLSMLSIAGGIAVIVFAGVCVFFSMRSQFAQYVSLTLGWHVLRIYSALQTIVLGILVVALSYWVTALWFHVYVVKLILICALFALLAAAVVIKAIFTTPKSDFVVEGIVIKRDPLAPLWQELALICGKVGSTAPDQVIAGIDDNFYVTEHPVTVDGKKYHGKTLFVSLPLLKQLNAAEADSVLAHEMAHFSGQDTLYSKRIAPLLMRYQHYLKSLYEGGITLPVYYFMLCFRMLFELTIQKISREREFRADKIAVETTSAASFAGAMLRIVAYSKFRNSVESDLFKQEQAMEYADVSDRIEKGFPAYAVAFASDPEIGLAKTTHPFDSHPPTVDRLAALGVKLSVEESQKVLSISGDGGWHGYIPGADELERQQWKAYEDRFRQAHEQSLPYRFLPETPEEQAVVERTFPEVHFESSNGRLTIDFEKVSMAGWSTNILFKDILNCTLTDKGNIDIRYQTADKMQSLPLSKFPKDQQPQVRGTFERYYGRYLAAAEYRKQVERDSLTSQTQASESPDTPTSTATTPDPNTSTSTAPA